MRVIIPLLLVGILFPLLALAAPLQLSAGLRKVASARKNDDESRLFAQDGEISDVLESLSATSLRQTRRVQGQICGDGQCKGKETCITCPQDCCLGPTAAPTPGSPTPQSLWMCMGTSTPCTTDNDCGGICDGGKDAGNTCATNSDCKNPGNCSPVPNSCQPPLTMTPTSAPVLTVPPTDGPTTHPTDVLSDAPTGNPTSSPSSAPVTNDPTLYPTLLPTTSPSSPPTDVPSVKPTKSPTNNPSKHPIKAPTSSPTSHPSENPTSSPTASPIKSPADMTPAPTVSPSSLPTEQPSNSPEAWPPLSYLGGEPNTTAALLQVCEGDCDGYYDCEIGLECYERLGSSTEPIPGCSGDPTANPGGDFCRVPFEGELAYIDNNGNREEELGLLGECQGDCDSYSDCELGLECFFRDGTEVVPGCGGNHLTYSGTDYCRTPVFGYVSYVSNNGNRIPDGELGLCQGDCDEDDDCQTHLLCFHHVNGMVPGCAGTAKSGISYCYDPSTPSPTMSPTQSLRPTISSAPTFSPTVSFAPTDVGDIPRAGVSRSLPSVGGESLEVSKSKPGLLVTLSKVISESAAVETVIPLARSYDGNDWESSAGEFATTWFAGAPISDCHNVFATGTCTIPLPALGTPATESYVISTYAYEISRRNAIARMLEKTTFGTTIDDLDSFEVNFGGGGTVHLNVSVAEYVKYQMEIEARSHREYYRKRTNPRWPYSLEPGTSDHPCSEKSHWRRYAFTRKDRYNPYTEEQQFLEISFPHAETEVLGSTIIEAEDALASGPLIASGTLGFTGSGYLDYRWTPGHFAEWTVESPSGAGEYQISFHYSNGGYDRTLEILVNEVHVSILPFSYVGSSALWTYTEFVTVMLIAGNNTIRAVQTMGNGPNIDHLRIGKDRPSAVLSINGKARTVVPELWLEGSLTYEFNASRAYEICNWPQTRNIRYSRGDVAVRIEDGTCKGLSVGNPLVSFPAGFEEYAPDSVRLSLPDLLGGQLIPSNIDDTDPWYYSLPNQTFLHLDPISDAKCDVFPEMSEVGDAPIFGVTADGTLLVWDPKLKLELNNEASPLSDGGGSVHIASGGLTECMNAPQTFLNEDTCELSAAGTTPCSASQGAPLTDILLNETNIITMYNLTGRYVYAIKGLVIKEGNSDVVDHPCTPGVTSRWERATNSNCAINTTLGPITTATLTNLILNSPDENPFITDIIFPLEGSACDSGDSDVEIQLQIGADCFTHVHPQHLDVYDVTYWTDPNTHPGNKRNGQIVSPHPIKKWAESEDKVKYPGWFLTFPSTHPTDNTLNHPMNRWETRNGLFDYVGRFGSIVAFRDLPNDLRLDQVAQHFGVVDETQGSVVVCGSIGEVPNEPQFGSNFDMDAPEFDTSSSSFLRQQRATVWTMAALESDDQLRQRMAWALSQILVIVTSGIDADTLTEPFLTYYDIFVRNAFGNYRDILAEISYSPLMAEHLSFLESKSAAYVFKTENRIAFADENFAREIMQLFTVGLYKLNQNGTQELDAGGNAVQVYDNEDIRSFARAWTGFQMQSTRGNIEGGPDRSENRLDPMTIDPEWRDGFPKSDLLDGYIGDGYPLCVDMPAKMFLRKGAKYRLLGGSPLPKLMADHPDFGNDSLNISRMVLNSASPLYSVLHGGGQYQATITLQSNLICFGDECNVDTVRVVKVEDVYFEYSRPPCVELSFYTEGKTINADKGEDDGQMCANPQLPHAREACLDTSNLQEAASRNYVYEGERMSYNMAEQRCDVVGKTLGVFHRISSPDWRTGYHWQADDCRIYAVINSEGYVAITHNPFNYNGKDKALHVSHKNLNFFKVYWEGGNYPTVDSGCTLAGCRAEGYGCLCQTDVNETQGFNSEPGGSDEILSKLFIGATDPASFDLGTFNSESKADFTVHMNATSYPYDIGTVFQMTDDKGRAFFLKNMKSMVNLKGWTYQPTIHEAEDADISGSQVSGPNCCNTGTGYVDLTTSNGFIEWTVNITQPGSYQIYFRYALSPDDGNDRPMSITVNGLVVEPSQSFPPTGRWDNWVHTEALLVSLDGGENVIRAQGIGNSGPNFDHLRIEKDGTVATAFSFRNAPHFVSLIKDRSPNGIGEATIRDSHYETNAVLDHYFYHDNTAPFLCIRFIQRLGQISNPSPRYIVECSAAFRTGSFTAGGQTFGTGKYGDLSATVAAILLDREAMSAVLDKDPAHGSLIEPLLKVTSLMRSMELRVDPRKPNAILWQLEDRIGQQAHEFETVFSHFLPEFISGIGPAGSAALVSPESQLIDMPRIIELLNGMFSMIKYGLSDCEYGFSRWPGIGSCSDDGDYSRASGTLDYQPAQGGSDFIVDELATLFTAGRLNEQNRQILKDTYDSFADKVEALKMCQQLISTSPEFHSTNTIAMSGGARIPVPKPPPSGQPYKAIVYLFLSGACDSFNMLAPHTCTGIGGEPDLYTQYQSVRGSVALNRSAMLEIFPNSTQPCTSFGIHPMLPALHQMYEDGSAIFCANAGVLAKPVTVENARDETPVQLFAHNSMQTETKKVDIYDEIRGTGVLGRLVDRLSRNGIRTGSFSINGNSETLTGQAGVSPTATAVSSSGLDEFNPKPSSNDMKERIKSMNNATKSDSGFFGETWSLALFQALDQHAELYNALEQSSLNTAFPDSSLGDQLMVVSQLIQTRLARGNDREVFYVSVGGYDTHSDVEDNLNSLFAELNDALDAFKSEMVYQGMWNSVVLTQFSEFARTLVPNGGEGTDHAWGGNHFIVGGPLKGGRVLGKYPSDMRRGKDFVLDDDRGRVVPTTPWDASWNGLAQWFGVSAANVEEVIPNKNNFPPSALFDMDDLFN